MITNKEKVCPHPQTQSGIATSLLSQQIAKFKKYKIVEGTLGCFKTTPDRQMDTSVVDQQKNSKVAGSFLGFA